MQKRKNTEGRLLTVCGNRGCAHDMLAGWRRASEGENDRPHARAPGFGVQLALGLEAGRLDFQLRHSMHEDILHCADRIGAATSEQISLRVRVSTLSVNLLCRKMVRLLRSLRYLARKIVIRRSHRRPHSCAKGSLQVRLGACQPHSLATGIRTSQRPVLKVDALLGLSALRRGTVMTPRCQPVAPVTSRAKDGVEYMVAIPTLPHTWLWGILPL